MKVPPFAPRKNKRRALRKGWGTLDMVRDRVRKRKGGPPAGYGTSFNSDGLSDGDNPYADADRALWVNAQGAFVISGGSGDASADLQCSSCLTVMSSNKCPSCHDKLHDLDSREDNNTYRQNTQGEQGGGNTATNTGGSKLDQAREARDGLARTTGKSKATVTGGYNTETGEVTAQACGGGKCAEDHVVDALGGDKTKVKFTEALRPRTGQEVPVCQTCEQNYGRDAFPDGTKFKSDTLPPQ